MQIQCLASGSKANCYKITAGDSSVLLDAGLPINEIKKKLNFRLSDIDFCLVTHAHFDHCKAAKDLKKMGVNIVMPERARGRKTIGIGDYTNYILEMEHDVECYGYILHYRGGLESLLYITDTYYCKYDLSNFKFDIIMVECNHSYVILDERVKSGELDPSMRDRLIRSHFSLENVKEFLKSLDLSETRRFTYCTLSDANSNEQQFKEEIQKLTGKPTWVCRQEGGFV